MGKLIGGILIGLVVGGAITFFTFVGVPRAAGPPGTPIRPPDAGGTAGSAQIVLRQDFFNEVLGAIFRDMNAPVFPLTAAVNEDGTIAAAQPGGCEGTIKLLPEGSGVRTGLSLAENRISAPLAFTGSYGSMLGCFPFTGWAQTNLELRYDEAQKKVLGNINVETVNLDGVNPLISGFVTPLVQTTLNNRVNPIQILQGEQIAVNTPLASTGSALKADVKEVRAEVKDNALHMYVNYAFSGAPLQ